jgi:hypothetical protein
MHVGVEGKFIDINTGWWYTYPLKNMLVSWDDDIPNIWGKKSCSKPPTRIWMGIYTGKPI